MALKYEENNFFGLFFSGFDLEKSWIRIRIPVYFFRIRNTAEFTQFCFHYFSAKRSSKLVFLTLTLFYSCW